jgi:modification methylase
VERNKILFGDTLDVMPTLPDESQDLIVTSPPYYNARTEYASWESYEAYVEWLDLVMAQLARLIKPGRRVCWNIMDYAIVKENGTFSVPISAHSIQAALKHGLELRDWIIWQVPGMLNSNAPTGTFPGGPSVVLNHSVSFVIVFQKPAKDRPAYTPLPPELEKYNVMGKSFLQTYVRSQVWQIDFTHADHKDHPAAFPEELVTPMIRMWTRPGELVFDPFMGSGTTAVAALAWRRDFLGTERMESYYHFAKKRVAERQFSLSQKGLFEFAPPESLDNMLNTKQKLRQLKMKMRAQ